MDRRTVFPNRSFRPLPVGAFTPRGWLDRQLRIQADGLSGNLDEFWPDLADNEWLGGAYGGWERGPYYTDGLVPLAHLLSDSELEAKAERWIDGFLESQTDDGWFGPVEQASSQGHEYDPWPRFVVLKALRQRYEITRDDAVLDAMTTFCDRLRTVLEDQPLEAWGRMRWPDLLVSVRWLYEQTGDRSLLDLANTAAEQGYDWNGHFASFDETAVENEWRMESHVVNNAMGVKTPAVVSPPSRDGEAERGPARPVDVDRAHRPIETLDRFHGQASGVFSGDECLAGRRPTRGTELCAVVEFMFSLEQLVATFGDPRFGDRLERVAYNALPAAFTPDMWAHQYDQQANQVLCSIADRPWTNGPDANLFGLEPNFGCCTANMHQGWPKFATHLWMGDDDGLAAVAYGPSKVRTTLGEGTPVTVTERTDYPFSDTVTVAVDPDASVTFPLSLRIPGWVDRAVVELPDGECDTPAAGTFHTIEREWAEGDEVTLSFDVSVRAERRWGGSVALHRGPLVYSLPIDADWKQVGGIEPHADWELYPAEEWNYGLRVDPSDPEVDYHTADPGERPFSPEGAPSRLSVTGRRIPRWELSEDWVSASDPPRSPVGTDTDDEALTLIPYGCTNLRITEFPIVTDIDRSRSGP